MSANASRRPPLLSTLAWYLPVPLLIVASIYIMHPLVLIPLLLANVAAMIAICHGLGFGPERGWTRTVLHRGVAWLVLFTAYTALVWLLVALPLVSVTTVPSIWGVLGTALALFLALAFLWRAWPAFGLIVLWDDAYSRNAQGSWIFMSLTRSLVFARHMAAEERFFNHFLPAALSTLALSAGALVLSGTYDVIPDELRTASLWLYGLGVMPVACLIIVDRTLRALLLEKRAHRPPPADDESGQPASHRERPSGSVDAPQPGPLPRSAGATDSELLQATREGDGARVRQLLDEGAHADMVPDVDDGDQRTPLTTAAVLEDTQLLRDLIAHGADVNRHHAGLTALLAASGDGCTQTTDAVTLLLANGADTAAVDADGRTALHHAAARGALTLAAEIADTDPALSTPDRYGDTALALACRRAHQDMVGWLLDHGADATAGNPALLAAMEADAAATALMPLLLAHKVNPDATDAHGRTALIRAVQDGRRDLIATLIDAGADPNVVDAHGTSALMDAARDGDTATVHSLLAAGATPDLRDRHDRDALILACQSPHADSDTVRALIAGGADPHAGSDDAMDAVDCATAAGRTDLLAVLDSSAPDDESATENADDTPETSNPEHLLDALRFGHWVIAERFTTSVREWANTSLAELFLELADTDAARARQWVLDHGLHPDAVTRDGRALMTAAIDALPDSASAMSQLLQAGASAAGASRLARAMSKLLDTAEIGVPLVREMLPAGADPFGPLHDGRTPVHLACVPGWQPVLDTLLATGANPDARDGDGSTPLHSALQNTDVQLATIRSLIAAGADPERGDANGETALGHAMNTGVPGILAWLRWPHWPLPGRRLQAADLPRAAACGDRDAVAKLLQLNFAVDAVDSQGASALIQACARGYRDVIVQLLDAGADVTHAADTGVNPLAAAVNGDRHALAELLLERGAAVDQRLPGGITTLMVACSQGHVESADALLAGGAAVDARDGTQRTPLAIAARFSFGASDSLCCRRLLDTLLAAGAEPNSVDQDGLSPLLILLGGHARPGSACDPTHIGALLPVLLEAGARHDHADPRGVTPLHACAVHALLAPARVLLQQGAERHAVDGFGRAPADVARQLGYTDMAVELDDRQNAVPGIHQTLHTQADPDA